MTKQEQNGIERLVLGSNRNIYGKQDSLLFERNLSIIEEEIQRCTRITKTILSSVREIPDEEDEKSDIDIHAVLDKALEMFKYLGRLKGVDVVRNYGEGIPAIHGSGGRLKQVFLSIIGNGLEAMDGRGTLTLDTGVEGDTLFIRVKDTGPGISSADLSRIFEPFFTTKSGRGGTGLGLSTANKIVKKAKGKIEVTSEEGQGASFKIILPC